MTLFKHHFSEGAASYAAHRPAYPAELAEFLAGSAPRCGLAWDCGCGSGQLSVLLADQFDRVIATDASPEQLAHAVAHPKVEYRCASAEASGLPDAIADLAVSAQAAHWFDLAAYYAEVRRVARPGAIIALVTYGLTTVNGQVDPVVNHFYSDVLGPYGDPERRHVEDGYLSLPFPFEEIETPKMEIRMNWALADFAGYVETWSAVRAMAKAEGRARIDAFRRDLARAWGQAATVRPIRWPLSVRTGRANSD